jgi:hypothetical protein
MASFIIATLFYLALAALGKSVSDVISFRYSSSIFSNLPERWQKWTNPEISWKNKHTGFIVTDWIFSTVLVAVTDLWHFSQMLYAFGLIMAGWFGNGLADHFEWSLQAKFLLFIAMYAYKGAIHEATFGSLFLKKDKSKSGRRVSGEALKPIGSNFSNWIGLGNTILKSIGSMSAIFIVFLGQLWVFRLIDGRYESIHQIPDRLQWPEMTIVIEFFILFLAALIGWIISIRVENKAKH